MGDDRLTTLRGIALIMQVGRGVWEGVSRPVSAPKSGASILHHARAHHGHFKLAKPLACYHKLPPSRCWLASLQKLPRNRGSER